MARINGIFPKQEQSEINYLKYRSETQMQTQKTELKSVISSLGINDTVEQYQDCISGVKHWRTSDGDHYPTFYTNGKMYLETGANSRIMIADTNYAYSGDLKLYPTDSGSPFRQSAYYGESGIAIDIYGVRTVLPLSANLADVHTAVMLCDYAIEKLRQMRPEEAKNSPLLKLKQSLETDLKAMKKGTQTTLQTPIFEYISEGTFVQVQKRAETKARIMAMINANLIPPETKFKKYPLDEEKLNQILPTIQHKYQLYLAKQERKAVIKQHKKELKLAKQEKRQQLRDERQKRKEEKAQKKQELEDLKQSMNEAQL